MNAGKTDIFFNIILGLHFLQKRKIELNRTAFSIFECSFIIEVIFRFDPFFSASN